MNAFSIFIATIGRHRETLSSLTKSVGFVIYHLLAISNINSLLQFYPYQYNTSWYNTYMYNSIGQNIVGQGVFDFNKLCLFSL